MAQETNIQKLRTQVIEILYQAQESLSEAHLICHEKLYPTWQTVDLDIQMLLRSVQALAIDLKRRNSDTAVLPDPAQEPAESAPEPSEKMQNQPEEPSLKPPKKIKSEPAPTKKKKAKAAKSSPARRKKEKIQKVVEPEPAVDTLQGCPWCDSQLCEEVSASDSKDGKAHEKVLVCLECGQTYSASTIEENH